jgi:hypothetical protein
MDGNGRWAKKRGLPRTAGHEAGEAALFDMLEGALEVGVKELSAYAFSTENWKRSPDEVKFLMGFNREVIRRRRNQMNDMGVRIRWVGKEKRLWKSVLDELLEAEDLTKKNKKFTLNMCVNYGALEITSPDSSSRAPISRKRRSPGSWPSSQAVSPFDSFLVETAFRSNIGFNPNNRFNSGADCLLIKLVGAKYISVICNCNCRHI